MSDHEVQNQTPRSTPQRWESLADELRHTTDVQRMKELVILLEEAIFNRQQEFALQPHRFDPTKIKQEERGLRETLDLILEVKIRKLGFPDLGFSCGS